jgi:hypothetical protein
MNTKEKQKELLAAVNKAIALVEDDDTVIDKQYFEELDEFPTILDLLFAVSITLESNME